MKRQEVYINVLMNLLPNFLYLLKRTIILSLINKHGKNIRGMRYALVTGYDKIEIGNNFFASKGLELSATNGIIIGNDVTFGPNVTVIGGNHKSDMPGLKINQIHTGEKHGIIIIEDDVWVGANVIILSGAHISEGAIIGAGSVVTNKMPPYYICAGNPCKPLKPRFESLSDLSIHLIKVRSNLTLNGIKKEFDSVGLKY